MAVSPTLPAVGFRYVNHPFLNEPSDIQRPENRTERFLASSVQDVETEDSLVTAREIVRCYEPAGRTEPENPAPSGESRNRATSKKDVKHPLLSEPLGIQRPGNEIERLISISKQDVETEDSVVTYRGTIPCYERAEETGSENPAPSGKNRKRIIYRERDLAKGMVRQGRAAPEPAQNNGSGVPEAELENPSVIVERPTVEIPGVSEKSSSGPSLGRKGQNARSGSLGNPVQQEASPTDSHEGSMKIPLFEAQENTSATNPPSAFVSAAKKSQMAKVVKEEIAAAPSLDRTENSLADNTAKTVRGKMRTSGKNEFLKKAAPLTVAREEKLTSELRQISGATPSQYRYVGADTLSRANRNAAERIERLQHAVCQLTARVSSHQPKVNHQAQQKEPAQAQPPPVKPVVIIKRLSSQANSPCAFWERRYLRRFHLKTLR
ncbi:MAG: hypothetical protein ACYSW8_03340 [Planctomycetota bacterium]